ncbi:hypothetical protein FRB99_008166 [Tulasnella sp. 403]|nr:hypothetical protein FRB99_008166 [Tulasnella sp. 403]
MASATSRDCQTTQRRHFRRSSESDLRINTPTDDTADLIVRQPVPKRLHPKAWFVPETTPVELTIPASPPLSPPTSLQAPETESKRRGLSFSLRVNTNGDADNRQSYFVDRSINNSPESMEPSQFPASAPATKTHNQEIKLLARLPKHSDRYSRARIIPKAEEIRLKPCPESVLSIHGLPDGWREYVHPEGQLYYRRRIAVQGRAISLVTDYPLRPRENQNTVHKVVEVIRRRLEQHPIIEDPSLPQWDFGFFIKESPEELEIGYYIASHQHQTVFHLVEKEPAEVGLYVPIEEPGVIKTALRIQYWYHIIHFPCHHELPKEVMAELDGITSCLAIDQMLCDASTAPSDMTTIADLQRQLRSARDALPSESVFPYRNWVAARLYFHFLSPRVYNYYATDCARLERDIKVGDGEPEEPERLNLIVQFLCKTLLWGEPGEMVRQLQDMMPDGLLYGHMWLVYITKLQTDWDRILVLSTIAFAGAMAFLSVPLQNSSSDNNGGNNSSGGKASSDVSGITPAAACAQAFAILSCIMSLACLIITINLRRNFSGTIVSRNNTAMSSGYLARMQNSRLGFYKLGICLSLPQVLFKWSIVFFCIGLAILAFELHISYKYLFYVEAGFTVILVFALLSARHVNPEARDADSNSFLSNASEVVVRRVSRMLTRFSQPSVTRKRTDIEAQGGSETKQHTVYSNGTTLLDHSSPEKSPEASQ